MFMMSCEFQPFFQNDALSKHLQSIGMQVGGGGGELEG